VTLWRDGVAQIPAHDMMEYLARLVGRAQEQAPSVAGVLLERSESIAGTDALAHTGPRSRAD
jgi:hypothetical protein